jgi:hypothetical protein
MRPFILLAVLAAVTPAFGDDAWASGRKAGETYAQFAARQQAGYEWRYHADDPGLNWQYLYRGGVQVGAYDYRRDVYRPYDAATKSWGAEARPFWKADPTLSRAVPAPQARNYGVDLDKLSPAVPVGTNYSINGKPVTKAQAEKAVAGSEVPDDGGKWRLTLVCKDEATRKRVVKDLHDDPSLAPLRDKVLLQSYADPGHWHLAPFKLGEDRRFQGSGFALFLQPPEGVDADGQTSSPVVQALYQYAGPEALRKLKPSYDGNKNDDGTAAPLSLANLPIISGAVLAVLGLGAVAFLVATRKKPAKVPHGPQGPIEVVADRPRLRPKPQPMIEEQAVRMPTFGDLLITHLEAERLDEEEAVRRKEEKDKVRAAFRQLAGVPDPPSGGA